MRHRRRRQIQCPGVTDEAEPSRAGARGAPSSLSGSGFVSPAKRSTTLGFSAKQQRRKAQSSRLGGVGRPAETLPSSTRHQAHRRTPGLRGGQPALGGDVSGAVSPSGAGAPRQARRCGPREKIRKQRVQVLRKRTVIHRAAAGGGGAGGSQAGQTANCGCVNRRGWTRYVQSRRSEGSS